MDKKVENLFFLLLLLESLHIVGNSWLQIHSNYSPNMRSLLLETQWISNSTATQAFSIPVCTIQTQWRSMSSQREHRIDDFALYICICSESKRKPYHWITPAADWMMNNDDQEFVPVFFMICSPAGFNNVTASSLTWNRSNWDKLLSPSPPRILSNEECWHFCN